MKNILIFISLLFGSIAQASDIGAINFCNELFPSSAYKSACIQSQASFETIHGCSRVPIIHLEIDMLMCIKTKASYETINACSIVFKNIPDLNECIATQTDFVTLNNCNRSNKTRKARDILACVYSALK